MLDKVLIIPRIISMLGLEYTRVVNMTRLQRIQYNCILNIHGILNVLSSEYTKVFFIRNPNML